MPNAESAEQLFIISARVFEFRRSRNDADTRRLAATHIYETIEDPGMRPPNLNTQGVRTKADWLFHFLNEPSTVRFWLNVRMPTFGFTEDQANTLVRAFMAMEDADPFEAPSPPVDPDSTLEICAPTQTTGTRIGRYKILQEIGEGGGIPADGSIQRDVTARQSVTH